MGNWERGSIRFDRLMSERGWETRFIKKADVYRLPANNGGHIEISFVHTGPGLKKGTWTVNADCSLGELMMALCDWYALIVSDRDEYF